MIISTEFEKMHYGVQEASGSIPLISTRKSPEIVRFQDFLFIRKTGIAFIRDIEYNADMLWRCLQWD